MTNPRAIAAKIIHQVIQEKRSLNTLLTGTLTQRQGFLSDHIALSSEIPDKAFVQELCYGTLRWYYRLKCVADRLLNSPLRLKDQDIVCLLLVGLYQLIYMRTPHYAAVSETVSAVKTLKKTWATGLLNKTLRRFLREKETLLKAADNSLSGHYAHPPWLIKATKKSWPKDWKTILKANNTRAPMTLRVNQQKISRRDYLSLLKENNITAVPLENNTAIQLEKPLPINQLPGFKEGFFYIQDEAGQLAATLLDLKPNQRVLDACAAPGSKTTHFLETEPKLEKLVAIDKDPERLQKIPENVDRLKLPHHNLKLILADASHTERWWDGNHFDRILLDAPCSATGVIRRHPDIKLLRKESDIPQYTSEQSKLLNTLWALLNNRGKLLYSTCSILPEENHLVIKQFLSDHTNDAELTFERQLLPTENGHDGFYYALLIKTEFK